MLVAGVVLAAEDERPLAGATVELRGWPRSDLDVAAFRGRLQWDDPPSVVSGGDGRFAFALQPLPPLGWDLVARAPGRAARHARFRALDEKEPQLTVRLVLPRAFPVRARAVDADGHPAQGAVLTLPATAAPATPGGSAAAPRAVSDAGGNLLFEDVAAGEHRVAAALESPWRVAHGSLLALSADGEVTGERILVERIADRVEGRLVDDRGAVLAGVALAAKSGSFELGRARSDAQGRFVLARHARPRLGGPPVHLETADNVELAPAPVWNAPPRDYVAARAGSIDLLVIDGDERPVERFAVQWLGGGKPARVGSLGGHHPRGRVDLGATPAGRTWIDVIPGGMVPGGDELGRAGVVAIDVAPAARQAVTVRVVPPVRRVVRVADGAGEPVARAEVTVLVAAPSAREQNVTFPQGRRVGAAGELRPWQLASSKTTHEARAVFWLPVGLRDYEIRVVQEGMLPARVPYVLDPTLPDAVIDVVLHAGSTVRGRIVPGDFAVHARRLGVRDGPLQVQAVRTLAEGEAQLFAWPTAEVASDGTFTLRGLARGRHELRVGVFAGFANIGVAVPPPLDVDGTSTVEYDLDLHAFLPGSLAGTLLVDGRPATGAKVQAHAQPWFGTPPQTTDGEGGFVFDALLPGVVRIATEQGIDPEPIEIRAGQRSERTFHLQGRPLRLRVLGPDGAPVGAASFTVRFTDGMYLGPWQSNDEGHIDVAHAPFAALHVSTTFPPHFTADLTVSPDTPTHRLDLPLR